MLRKDTQIGEAYQVDLLPSIGDDDAEDKATLVWEPHELAMSFSATASFLRKWSRADLEMEALTALGETNGDADRADGIMKQKHVKGESSLADDGSRGALFTASIIEHRKDLVLAQKAIASKGTSISMNALQRFYFAHFRRAVETIALDTHMVQEMEMDDGLDDHCAICGQRGLLVCCDACSNVYHLSCVKLDQVPDGEWKCPDCLNPPPQRASASGRPQRAAAWTGPVKPIAMPNSNRADGVHVFTFRGPRKTSPTPEQQPASGAAGGAGAAGGSAPTKRKFRTDDGREYEQDMVTGQVAWCPAPGGTGPGGTGPGGATAPSAPAVQRPRRA